MRIYLALVFVVVVVVLSSVSWAKKYKCIAGITDLSYTQHCSSCGPPDGVHLNLAKLTVGNENNTVHDDNMGEVCIEGTAKIPMGFMKPTDTLDLRARVSLQLYNIRIPIHCGIIHAFVEKMLFPERFDATGEKITGETTEAPSENKAWISNVFSHFDYKTCTVSDICGLLKPGEGLRNLVDDMMTNTTDDDLGGLGEVFANYTSTKQDNACSADFFDEQLKSISECYTLGSANSKWDLSALKDMAMGAESMDIELVIEVLKRDTAKSTSDNKQQPEEHILCLFMPLHVVFD